MRPLRGRVGQVRDHGCALLASTARTPEQIGEFAPWFSGLLRFAAAGDLHAVVLDRKNTAHTAPRR